MTKKTRSSKKKTTAKKPVEASNKSEVKQEQTPVAEQAPEPVKVKKPPEPVKIKKPLMRRSQVVEIPIFNSKIKAVFVMERGNVTLFRSVGPEKFTIQVPTSIIPKNL